MNNINIKNIFNDKLIEVHSLTDINYINIVSSNTGTSITDDFLINKIKINKISEDEKIEELYIKKNNECLLKINDAIDLNLTDIFFKIQKSYFGYKRYDSKKCLELIQNNLRKKNFETLIYSDTEIFISWKDC